LQQLQGLVELAHPQRRSNGSDPVCRGLSNNQGARGKRSKQKAKPDEPMHGRYYLSLRRRLKHGKLFTHISPATLRGFGGDLKGLLVCA
jgi:hypothetical protein